MNASVQEMNYLNNSVNDGNSLLKEETSKVVDIFKGKLDIKTVGPIKLNKDDHEKTISGIFSVFGFKEVQSGVYDLFLDNLSNNDIALQITGYNREKLIEDANYFIHLGFVKKYGYIKREATILASYLSKSYLDKLKKDKTKKIFSEKFNYNIPDEFWEKLDGLETEKEKGDILHALYIKKQDQKKKLYKLRDIVNNRFAKEGLEVPKMFWKVSVNIDSPEEQNNYIKSEIKRLKKEIEDREVNKIMDSLEPEEEDNSVKGFLKAGYNGVKKFGKRVFGGLFGRKE